MRQMGLTLAAGVLALLVWLPLGVAGVPLDTPDGFLHLGWAVGWARQVAGGWWWPQWTDQFWAGAGSFAPAIYPPLFRLLVGVPLLLGTAPDQALAGALLAVLALNAAGALALARLWLPPGHGRWWLLLGAGLNPYLLVNLYVRGAWPEALAQALLWWLVVGLVAIRSQRRWGAPVAAAAIAAVLLSNWNAALLTLLLWGVAAAALALDRRWRCLALWLAALVLALASSAPFWWPALQLLPQLRAPMPAGLFPGEFFLAGALGNGSFARLLWIQGLVLALLIAGRWLAAGWRGDWLGRWGLAVALLSLVMMLPLGHPIYQLVSPLQRIQFPWRWLGPAWLGALIWLGSAAPGQPLQPRPGRWRRLGGGLLLVAALAGWFDGLWRFRANLLGHAPTPAERRALRQLLACDPLRPCPAGVTALPARGELAKRFVALPDGRIALAGVPDYSPAGLPAGSWRPRLQTFWLPAWPQVGWARFRGRGAARLTSHGPRQRTLVVRAAGAGTLELMQWAHPAWRVQWRPAPSPSNRRPAWTPPLPAGGRNRAGWIAVPLPAGSWQVALTYGASRQPG